MKSHRVYLLWLYTVGMCFIVLLVLSTAQDEEDTCAHVLNLGVASDEHTLRGLQQDLENLKCLNFSLLDIHNVTSLQQYYLSAEDQDLSLLYLYSDDCHFLAIMIHWLTQSGGGPVMAVATPTLTCPPIPDGNLFSIGPDWSELVSVIDDVVEHEDASHVVLLHGSRGFPYTIDLRLKLSLHGVTLTTRYVDLASEDLGDDLLAYLCSQLTCATSGHNSTGESVIVVVAVFENDNSSLTFLEKTDMKLSKNALWLIPLMEISGLNNHSIFNPNVYFVVPHEGYFQTPEENILTITETLLSYMNSTDDIYDLDDEETESSNFYSDVNCSNTASGESEKKESIVLRILRKYFPYSVKSQERYSFSSQDFTLQHFVTSSPSEVGLDVTPVTFMDSDSATADSIGTSLGTNESDNSDSTAQQSTQLVISGNWEVGVGLELNGDESLYEFDGLRDTRKFIVGTYEAPPFTSKDSNNTWSGFAIDMTMEIMQRIGMSYEIVESTDGKVGAETNGTWNGLIKMAQNQEIDLAVGPISLTPERAAVVDYVQPIMEDGGGIIVKKVEDPTDKLFYNLRPFRPEVWATIFGSIFVVSIVFAAVNHNSPYSTAKIGYENLVTLCIHKVRDSIWIILSSYADQGAARFPYNTSGRLILGCWWVFAILMSASYTAELAATLTLSIAKEPIGTLADLAAQTDIKPIARRGTSWYSMIEKGESDVFKKLWKMMEVAPKVDTPQEGLDLVMKGGYALITDYSQLSAYRKKDCDNLVIGTEVFNKSGLGFFVPQGSPWRKKIDSIVVSLHEAGIVEKYRKKWWSLATQCVDTDRPIIRSVGLDSSGAQYIIMACVMLFAVVTAFLEVVWHRLPCRKEREKEITGGNSNVQDSTRNYPSSQIYNDASDYLSSEDFETLDVEDTSVEISLSSSKTFGDQSGDGYGNDEMTLSSNCMDSPRSCSDKDYSVNEMDKESSFGRSGGTAISVPKNHNSKLPRNGMKRGEVNFVFHISDEN